MTAITKKESLKSIIVNNKWNSLTPNDLDIGYAALTIDQKQTIIDSIVDGDSGARDLIKSIFSVYISQYADNVIDQIEADGVISITMLDNLLQ